MPSVVAECFYSAINKTKERVELFPFFIQFSKGMTVGQPITIATVVAYTVLALCFSLGFSLFHVGKLHHLH